jgi:zinc protease
MKKITLSILTLALATSAWAQPLDRSIKPKAGPAPEVKLGKTESFTLPNGLKVFIVENHKLPLVTISTQLHIQQELQGNMAGYTDVVGELLSRGTAKRTKDQLNEEIDFIGATLSTNSEGATIYGLKKHQTKMMDILSDVLLNSKFSQEELDKIKKQALSGMETQKNDPESMMGNVSKILNYTSNHPYGEVETEATIEAITLDRCNKYYKTYFKPNVAYLAIVGDVTLAEMKPLITKYFGGWEKADVPEAIYIEPSAPMSPKVAFVPREAAVQSVINITAPNQLKPGDKDEFAAKIANTVLGGGSQGRLFFNLREKHAWTYGAYSSLTSDPLVGNFNAFAKTRNIVTDSSIAEIINEMKQMNTETIDETTLQNTKNYIGGNFSIGLESPERVAQYAINIDRFKLPADYYATYLKKLNAVNSAEVKEAAQKYMNSQHMNIIVVGSKEEVAEKVAKYAKNNAITYYDNYGKIIVPSETKSAGNVKFDDVHKKYLAAIGGDKAIKGLKSIKTIRKGNLQGAEITIYTVINEKGKLKNVVNANAEGQNFTINKVIFNGVSGTSEIQGQSKALTAEEIQEIKQQADLQAVLDPAKYGEKQAVRGIVSVNGKDAYYIENISKDGKKSSEYYDVATGFLVKSIGASNGDAPGQVTEFSDYKEVPGSNGYKVPYTMKLMGANFTLQTVEVNKTIADKEFE